MAEELHPHRGVDGLEQAFTFEDIQDQLEAEIKRFPHLNKSELLRNMSQHVFGEVLDFVDPRGRRFVLLIESALLVLYDQRRVSSTHFSSQSR